MSLGKTTGSPTPVGDRFALIESAPDAMVIVGADGRVAFVNTLAEKLFGYPRNDLIGQHIELLMPERFRSGHIDRRDGYMREPRTRPMGAGLELYGRRKGGAEFPVEISLSPVHVDGETFVVSAIRDGTEHKAFERVLQEKNDQLEKASQAKDRFLTSMSHELRTPLNAVIGFTGTLLMKLPGPLTGEQERQLRIVQSSARHLLSLINDLLDLTKLESGKIELHFESVPLADIVTAVVDSLRSLAREKQLSLTTLFSHGDLTLETDRRALHQILLNLTNNAIKFTEKGSVRIGVEATNGDNPGIALRVTDTGIGIDPHEQARLFQPFEQLDASSTRRFEGSGLGLYLSGKLATLLGGRLTVESASGQGSTFTLTLPLSQR